MTDERPVAATDADARSDLLILGVGRASPRVAGALAEALELPIELVVDAIYRAPARLLANLPHDDAQRLAGIVAGLGLEVAAAPAGEAPPRAAVLDIAADLVEPAAADAVADALGRFLGMPPEQALETLLTPPGIVLGNVTAATVQALDRALPAGAVELTASEAATARYALFAGGLSAAQRAVLRPHIAADAATGADGSVTLFDLERGAADALWRRLKAPEGVRIVNQAFLRFTLWLTAMPADATAGVAALEMLAGVPAEDYPLLAEILPVPVAERVPMADVPERLAAFAQAGFGARAELSTFGAMALHIYSAPPGVLAGFGFDAAPPFATPPMAEPRARLLRARLEAAGVEVVAA
ncbi:hypothetical protein [Sandaracinobacteroides saxicola]|uniref:Uncharacterized protein n=1 Tax=Sandaracinobacteroides saxicola TaxID=2759707 RepID=A0A7G5IHK7_9SPHN|nr:hypothetical protein [Sandaracinobacteroides saxicola]QMW22849.1 hypothetical protein H3309_16385 [Sandaracinobacteroides saxicola]